MHIYFLASIAGGFGDIAFCCNILKYALESIPTSTSSSSSVPFSLSLILCKQSGGSSHAALRQLFEACKSLQVPVERLVHVCTWTRDLYSGIPVRDAESENDHELESSSVPTSAAESVASSPKLLMGEVSPHHCDLVIQGPLRVFEDVQSMRQLLPQLLLRQGTTPSSIKLLTIREMGQGQFSSLCRRTTRNILSPSSSSPTTTSSPSETSAAISLEYDDEADVSSGIGDDEVGIFDIDVPAPLSPIVMPHHLLFPLTSSSSTSSSHSSAAPLTSQQLVPYTIAYIRTAKHGLHYGQAIASYIWLSSHHIQVIQKNEESGKQQQPTKKTAVSSSFTSRSLVVYAPLDVQSLSILSARRDHMERSSASTTHTSSTSTHNPPTTDATSMQAIESAAAAAAGPLFRWMIQGLKQNHYVQDVNIERYVDGAEGDEEDAIHASSSFAAESTMMHQHPPESSAKFPYFIIKLKLSSNIEDENHKDDTGGSSSQVCCDDFSLYVFDTFTALQIPIHTFRSVLAGAALALVTGDATLNEAISFHIPFWYSAPGHKRFVEQSLRKFVRILAAAEREEEEEGGGGGGGGEIPPLKRTSLSPTTTRNTQPHLAAAAVEAWWNYIEGSRSGTPSSSSEEVVLQDAIKKYASSSSSSSSSSPLMIPIMWDVLRCAFEDVFSKLMRERGGLAQKVVALALTG